MDVLLLSESGAYRGMNDTVEFDAGSSAGGSFFFLFPPWVSGQSLRKEKKASLPLHVWGRRKIFAMFRLSSNSAGHLLIYFF
jgi:hypothetical protein